MRKTLTNATAYPAARHGSDIYHSGSPTRPPHDHPAHVATHAPCTTDTGRMHPHTEFITHTGFTNAIANVRHLYANTNHTHMFTYAAHNHAPCTQINDRPITADSLYKHAHTYTYTCSIGSNLYTIHTGSETHHKTSEHGYALTLTKHTCR